MAVTACTPRKATVRGNTAGAFAVVAPPAASASFTPASIAAGGTSELTLTIGNAAENTVVLYRASELAATLPSGLSVASPNDLDASCGGTVVAEPGSDSIALSGGSVPAGASCTITVDVTAAAQGTFTMTSGAAQSGQRRRGQRGDREPDGDRRAGADDRHGGVDAAGHPDQRELDPHHAGTPPAP